MAWTIDPAHTTVSFVARHLGLSKVRGQFTRFEGSIEGDPNDITTARARFEVDMTSVDSGSPDRDGHLKSADFFDVEKFPKMTFVGKSISGGGDTYKVIGDLTIKDVTKEVELTYEHGGETVDPFGNRKLGGTLTGTINRKDWGLTWNVALETGGWLVSDKITIEVDLQVAESQEVIEQEVELEKQSS